MLRSMMLDWDLNEVQRNFLLNQGYVLEMLDMGTYGVEKHWVHPVWKEDSPEETETFERLEELE